MSILEETEDPKKDIYLKSLVYIYNMPLAKTHFYSKLYQLLAQWLQIHNASVVFLFVKLIYA